MYIYVLGVVILSEFSTCSGLLNGSLKINPFDPLKVADAIEKGLMLSSKDKGYSIYYILYIMNILITDIYILYYIIMYTDHISSSTILISIIEIDNDRHKENVIFTLEDIFLYFLGNF